MPLELDDGVLGVVGGGGVVLLSLPEGTTRPLGRSVQPGGGGGVLPPELGGVLGVVGGGGVAGLLGEDEPLLGLDGPLGLLEPPDDPGVPGPPGIPGGGGGVAESPLRLAISFRVSLVVLEA